MSTHSDAKLLAKTLTAIAEEPYQEYWRGLGRFIHIFAKAESRLLSLLREIAGIPDIVSGILFSGTRQDIAKDHINRILEATGQLERKTKLDRPLAQLSAIATIRNNLVHWGARHDGSPELLVSNSELNPTPERLKEFRISPDDLKNMSSDLERITLFFWLDLYPSAASDEVFSSYLQGPWLYKPPQPPPPLRSPPRNPPTRSRQPRASRS